MKITAEEIDNNKKQIIKNVEAELVKYIRQRLSKEVRELKAKMQLENPEWILSKEEKDSIKERILNDDETKAYKEYQFELQKKKSENYFVVRETIQDLNELNEFSADIERIGLQSFEHFKTYRELIQMNITLLDRFIKYKEIRKQNISTYLTSYENKKLPFHEDDVALCAILAEQYKVTKDYDDIDLYDKFGMESNIDISNKLGDFYLHRYVNFKNDKNSNIINDWFASASKFNLLDKFVSKQLITNKLLGQLLLSNSGTGRTSFVTNNAVTCYTSMYVTTKNNQQTYVTRTLGELLLEITNPKNADLKKTERQQIYSSYDGTRPTSDSYYSWNGLQVFDIDLKEWEQCSPSMVEILKKKIFEYLNDFHWFLWVAKSASGKGIHIYTKVAPPHHVYTDVTKNEYISKYWFNINYAHKSSIIYDTLYRIHNDSSNTIRFKDSDFIDDFELRFLDNVVRRITAGIRLTYDNNVLVNHDFMDLHPAIGLSQSLPGDIYKVLCRDTTFQNKLIDHIDNELRVDKIDDIKQASTIEEIDLSKYEFAGELTQIQPLQRQSINYNIRYHVCNTLAALFGKEGLSIAHLMLQSELCKNVKEINSFYTCAISNKKEPSKLGLDILKKAGVIKQVKQDIKEYVDNKYKNHIRKLIENALDNQLVKPTIELKPHEYLGNKVEELTNPMKGGFTNSKVNVLLSPPGSGKTQLLIQLAKQGKRILLVEPFISVIKNKVEKDKDLMKIFQVFYGDKKLDELEPNINAVSTFDKFSKCNYEKLSRMFDYICIDESHLLFTSSYRIEATSQSVKKIKELYFISSNDPFAAKIIMMTGTETGESFYFGDISNIIRVSKESLHKELEFLICDDNLDAITRLSYKVYQLISDGYRLLIPTNKGEIYANKLIGMVEYLLGRPVKFGYYKRSNTEQEICRLINDSMTVGDYEIVFCSNYLSVGVDITDKYKFASVYFGPFSGFEVEQFNARIRKTGIKSIYCVQTEKNDGTTSDILIEEPKLALKITDEDIEHFTDDKQIAKAKQTFIAEYDPILHKITTPGFSYLNGAIRFNLEEYELVSFESKYLEAMVHPVKVARELSKYGYKISVSPEYDGLPEDKQEELKKIGIEAARQEKIRKHNLLVGTFLGLIENNYHKSNEGLEFVDIISWLGKHRDIIFEDRDQEDFIKIIYNIFAVPEQIIVKSREAFDAMYLPAKYLISKYSVTKAKDIILQYVDDYGILKQKQFKRAINLLKLLDKSESNDLSEPVFKSMERMYDWIDKFMVNKSYRISYNTYQATLDEWTNQYIDSLGITVASTYGYEKIRDSLVEMLNDIAMKNTSKDGIRYEYNKLPDQDGTLSKYRKSIDSMIENMFNITSEVVSTSKRVRQNHVVLSEQQF